MPLHPAGVVEETAEITLTFDDNRLATSLFGHYDQDLAHLERRLGVDANANGNRVVVKGALEASEQARRVLEGLYDRVRGGAPLSLGDVDGAIQESALQGNLFPGRSPSRRAAELRPGRDPQARTGPPATAGAGRL